MKKFIQNKLKEQKGLTLIELLAVIVILAIIAAIAIPAIGSMIENSRNGAVKADFQNAISSANIYFTENPQGMAGSTAGTFTGTVTVEKLVEEKYLDDKGSLADAVVITKATGGNTISGSATANGKTYTIQTAQTNQNLSKIKNAEFTGGDIKYTAPAGG